VSQSFSLLSWASRILTSGACIQSGPPTGRYSPSEYYSLAEDRKGSHCPFPVLPKWGQELFRWKVALDINARAWAREKWPEVTVKTIEKFFWPRVLNRLYRRFLACPIRGRHWWFHCQNCGRKDFFSVRGCDSCGHVQRRNASMSRWVIFEHRVIRWHRRWTAQMARMDRYRSWVEAEAEDWRVPF
jgi:hypothetical protein